MTQQPFLLQDARTFQGYQCPAAIVKFVLSDRPRASGGQHLDCGFHQYVLRAGAEVRFVRSRVRFELPDREPNGRCPFPSLVVVWRPPTWVPR